ncbi:Catalytic [Durusdinium trenchii]|uniref:Putative n=1 Tax=Durusdinium trenchii TaxID=1381693 RepID=A0ABP0JT34_9DINO
MDSDYWESYYARSLQRRGGSLRSEDCYCDPDSLMPLLPIHHAVVGDGSDLHQSSDEDRQSPKDDLVNLQYRIAYWCEHIKIGKLVNFDLALLVGSGTSELPQRLVEKGWKVWAMDVSPSCVAWMEKLQPKVEWCCADAFALPESWSNTFDLVLDKGLLGPKASEDPCGMALGQLLAQYRRVLQPGEGLS